jgi:hypothetical protein
MSGPRASNGQSGAAITRRDGGSLNAVVCDVFVVDDANIKHPTSYLMEGKA